MHTINVLRLFGPSFLITRVCCNSGIKSRLIPVLISRCYSDGEREKDMSVASGNKWRVPFSERDELWYSKFSLFGSKDSSPPTLYRFNPQYFSVSAVKNWIKEVKRDKLLMEQQYLEQRHNALGNDLAAAHFIVYRNGSVRFCGHTEWIKHGKEEYDDHLPNKYVESLYVEALDLKGTTIIYEGLVNISNLMKLKWLSFQGCPHFDDWCLDRISGAYYNTLEYLDISDTQVTERGVSALYRMEKLNTLKVNNISSSTAFQLACLMLEDINPNLKIEGITYMELDKSDGKQVENTN